MLRVFVYKLYLTLKKNNMAIELQNKTNVQAPDSTWPFGKTLDDTGSNDGTPLDHATLTDYFQFFARMAGEAGITFNGLPDNDVNGWQYYQSLKMVTRPGIIVADISASALMSTYATAYGQYISQALLRFTGQVAAITFTMDASANYDEGCYLMLKNNGDYAVTITPDGTDTINGEASFTLLPGATIELMLQSATGNWVFKYGTNDSMTVGVGSAPAYNTPWAQSAYGGTVKFRKDPNGLVTIEGVATRAAGAGSSSCFTLPVGFRPGSNKLFPATITDGVTPVAEIISISAAGTVQLVTGTGLSGYYPGSTFDVTLHCSFYAAD